MTTTPRATDARRPRAILVGADLKEDRGRVENPLSELARLAGTAGADVVGEVLQRRDRPDAAFFIGKGKAEEVARAAEAAEADLVLFDNDLTPSQERNLNRVIGREVIDRSRLILDIFATHARTRQARLQVELAQLEYMRSRLKRMWTHLERLEGNIGSRGPGEKQLEVDKRLVAKRIQFLRKSLETVERQQETRSASRAAYFRVSLVGYTNAGKSTLLRTLTGSEALIQDQLFATLDTQTRAWTLPGNQRVFLSDTVGFIRDLPHHLVASFHSTLAEVVHADLLLHVVDVSSPDAEHHIDVVLRVLAEIGAGAHRSVLVFNKLDAVDDPLLARALLDRHPEGIAVSAHTGEGIDELARRVLEVLHGGMAPLELEVPAGDGRLLAYIAERTEVLERTYGEGSVRLRVVASPRDAAHIRAALGLRDVT